MNDLQIFSNEDFGEIRTINVNGKLGFIAADIANALGYTNSRKSVNDHCKGVIKCYIPTTNGMQNMSVIFKPDVYRLIVRSKLPKAEKFEEWIFEEVLPSIHETGSYSITQSKENKLIEPIDIFKSLVNVLEEQNSRIKNLEDTTMECKKTMFDYEKTLTTLESKVAAKPERGAVNFMQLADELGYFSETGLPHAKFIEAVAKKCDIPIFKNKVYNNKFTQGIQTNVGGVVVPVIYVKPCAQELIAQWLEDNFNKIYEQENYKKKYLNHNPGEYKNSYHRIDKYKFNLYDKDGNKLKWIDFENISSFSNIDIGCPF